MQYDDDDIGIIIMIRHWIYDDDVGIIIMIRHWIWQYDEDDFGIIELTDKVLDKLTNTLIDKVFFNASKHY